MTNSKPAPDLNDPSLYINRELSLLGFNERVLAMAQNPATPLLERLKYLCISSTNLDEFFEIRVAGLKQRIASGAQPLGPDQTPAVDLLSQVTSCAKGLVERQYEVLNDVLIPALAEEGIRFVRRTQWTEGQAAWIRRYFTQELLPVLSPLGLDPSHPFPRILNKSLNFIVSIEGKDAFGRSSGTAIVQAPRSLPRLIHLPESCTEGVCDFVFLSSIIHAHVDDLFPGMKVTGCYQFRVTRNSDLYVDEEEIEDLKRAMESELLSRRYGDAVRLEVADNCTTDMTDFLRKRFKLDEQDVHQVNGPVNLNRLLAIPDLVDRPELKYPPFTPGRPAVVQPERDIFSTLRRQDVLLHHPFESFLPVVEFLHRAALDPNVLAIKQTLYRTGPDSPVVKALVDAAKAGKEVTVVVELKARFDEEANIGLATRLQEAGAHVVYGVVGYKTHAKMILVTRRERRSLRHYVHLGTGNYHLRTAGLYTDYGLLTSDKALGEDVHRVFQLLTSLGRVKKLKKILQAPFTLHKETIRKIERETAIAGEGRPARIIAKMNALIEPQVIQALYAASQAGVKVDLIVRGVCCLRPGIKGVSENIQVRSVIGRYLEHSRIFYYQNDGDSELFLSSADWMGRNFFQRVETCFPIRDPDLAKRILKEGLETYLADNTQAWLLQADGSYRLCQPNRNQKARTAQTQLMEQLGG